MKRRNLVTLLPLFSALILSSCIVSEVKNNNVPDDEMFKADETTELTSYDVEITFNGENVSYPDVNKGISYIDKVLKITQAGSYKFSGNASNISIIVDDDGENYDFVLGLNNFTIENSSAAPILVYSADKVILTSISSTTNSISSSFSSKYQYGEKSIGSTIYSNDDLSFNGGGSLNVSGALDAINVKDDLVFYGGSYSLSSSSGKGMTANDSIRIGGEASITINSVEDSIHVENDLNSAFFYMESGNVTATSVEDALDVNKGSSTLAFTGYIRILGGTLNLTTTGTSKDLSHKGIKCKGDAYLNNANVTLNTNDDGIHVEQSLTIDSGNYSISCVDDGIHAANTFNLNGGAINIVKAGEGVESNHININGGSITVNATDDGFNAAKKVSETPSINITGGIVDITVRNGDVDGIDSNGSYTQSGGLVITRGAKGSNNHLASGLDCDGGASISAGTFICVGSMESSMSKGTGVYGFQLGVSSGGQGGGQPPQHMKATTYSFTAGTWNISSIDVAIVLTGSYTGISIYSSLLSSGQTVTISNGSTSYNGTAS